MPPVPAPIPPLTEAALAEWLDANDKGIGGDPYTYLSRAVIALVDWKVREAIELCHEHRDFSTTHAVESIVAKVLS